MIALTFCLRLVKDETIMNSANAMKFSNSTYLQLTDAILKSETLEESIQNGFCDSYLNKYYDLQFYFLQNAAYFIPKCCTQMQKMPSATLLSDNTSELAYNLIIVNTASSHGSVDSGDVYSSPVNDVHSPSIKL